MYENDDSRVLIWKVWRIFCFFFQTNEIVTRGSVTDAGSIIASSRCLFSQLTTIEAATGLEVRACLLTPWCRILFEKLIVTQLVKKCPAFLWNPNVHYSVHKSPPLDPILNQPNPDRPIDTRLPKVHLNVILPPTPRSSQWFLTFGPERFETFRNKTHFYG
jgi:hypothetical protein